MKALPHENIIYFGDTLHCPYGPRSFDEVASFVEQIGTWLVDQGVKMIVIACNTATAAGLSLAQTKFPVPVIGSGASPIIGYLMAATYVIRRLKAGESGPL